MPEGAEEVYFFVNADESEPGTFKDRYCLDYDPHMTIEGTIISSFATRSKLAFIYIRGEFRLAHRPGAEGRGRGLRRRLPGAEHPGSGYDLDLIVHKGAGAYICGEETGLINSVEGRKGQPSIKPPFPAVPASWASPPS